MHTVLAKLRRVYITYGPMECMEKHDVLAKLKSVHD